MLPTTPTTVTSLSLIFRRWPIGSWPGQYFCAAASLITTTGGLPARGAAARGGPPGSGERRRRRVVDPAPGGAAGAIVRRQVAAREQGNAQQLKIVRCPAAAVDVVPLAFHLAAAGQRAPGAAPAARQRQPAADRADHGCAGH